MRRALVTGVYGQDGVLLARRLVGAGWNVHGTARAVDVGVDLDRVTVHEADLLDPTAFGALIAQIEPDLVVNLAGVSSVARSWEDPVTTSAVSGHAVAVLLDAVARLGPGARFVQASSAEIFGDAPSSPQSEATPIRPINPYGAAKAYAHSLVRIARSRGAFASSAILFNHESPARPVSFVTRKITQGVARIAAGRSSSLQLGNLEARRDWSWAEDVIEAILLIAEAEEPDDFVVASGQAHSVREFVDAAFRAVGIDDWTSHVEVSQEFLRVADAAESRGDASRIRTRLGWEPRVGFDEMVRRMVEADLARIEGGSA